MRRTLLPLLLAALAAATTLSCDNDDADDVDADAMVNVRGQTLSYDPESVTINAGETVLWSWSAGGHSVTSVNMNGGIPGCTSNGQFDSGTLATGATFTHTFTVPGTYGYACSTAGHCAGFESGVVVVQ